MMKNSIEIIGSSGRRWEVPLENVSKILERDPRSQFANPEDEQLYQSYLKTSEEHLHETNQAKRQELAEQNRDTDPGFFDKTGAFVQGVGEKLGALADTGIAAGAATVAGITGAASTIYDTAVGATDSARASIGRLADGQLSANSPQIDQQPKQEGQSFSSKAWDVAKDYWNNPKIEKAATDALKPNYTSTFTEQANTMDNYHQAGKLLGSLPELAVGGAGLKAAGTAIKVIGKGGQIAEKVGKGIDFLNKFLTIKPTPKTLTAIGTGAVLGEKAQLKTEQKMNNSFEGYTASHPDPYMDKLEGEPVWGENFLRSMVGFMVGDATVNLTTKAGVLAARKLNKIGQGTQEALEYLNTDINNKFSKYVKELVNEDIKDVNKEISNINEKVKLKEENKNWKINNPIQGLYNMILKSGNTELDTAFLEKINPELLNPKLPRSELLKIIENDKELLNAFIIFKDNKRAYDIARYFPSYIYTKEILPSMDEAAMKEVKKTIGDRIFDLNPHDPESVVSFQSEKLKGNTRNYVEKIKEEHEFLHNWYKDALKKDGKDDVIINFNEDQSIKLFDLSKKFKPLSTMSGDLGKIFHILNDLSIKVGFEKSATVTEILNERATINQLANDVSVRLSKKQKVLLNDAVTILDNILKENVESGTLSPQFLNRFNHSRQFDTDIYYANIKNDVIKAIVSGEQPRYVFDQMNSSEGYLRVKEALTGIGSEVKQNKQTFKDFASYNETFKYFNEKDREYIRRKFINNEFYKTPQGKEKTKVLEKIHEKRPRYGSEYLEKSKEIFKTLETLKVQHLIFEDMFKGQKLDYNRLILNLQGLKYNSVLEHILGSNISKELRHNVKPILEKLKDVDKYSSIYDATLRTSAPNDIKLGLSKTGNFGFSSSMGGIAGGATGYAIGGPIGAAAGAFSGQMLHNKIAKGFAIACSDPKTVARMIRYSHEKGEKGTKGLVNYLLKLADSAITPGQKVNVYNKINNKENRRDAKEALTPSRETMERIGNSMIETGKRGLDRIAY